jgi:hypothetical protein
MTRMRDGLHQAADWTRRGGAATAAVVREHVPASSAADQRIAQLERLGRLRESGVLDADEFAAQKTALLADEPEPVTEPNGAAAPPPPPATSPQP